MEQNIRSQLAQLKSWLFCHKGKCQPLPNPFTSFYQIRRWGQGFWCPSSSEGLDGGSPESLAHSDSFGDGSLRALPTLMALWMCL